jgi:hypothetical protein
LAASYADNDVWHVMIADDMKRMNVEQLDDAFRLSLVDASTLVWKAGMRTWQSLGAVAGLEDDEGEDSVTRLRAAVPTPPPPPRPLARPAPKPPTPRRLAPIVAPPSALAMNPFLAATPVISQPFAPVVAPVARRAVLDSAVDFRRKGRGVRWGRWATLAMVLAVGVLGAYRQNLLREGARRIGVENKYLYGERRVTEYVSAKAPPAVKQVLTQLALLPGPNAEPAAKVTAPSAQPSPPPALTVAPAAPLASSVTPKTEPEVQTVTVTSLPVLEPPAAPPSPPRAPAARRVAATRPAPKASPKAAAAPRAEPAPPARPTPKPAADENPLKAAIRSAIAADAKK